MGMDSTANGSTLFLRISKYWHRDHFIIYTNNWPKVIPWKRASDHYTSTTMFNVFFGIPRVNGLALLVSYNCFSIWTHSIYLGFVAPKHILTKLFLWAFANTSRVFMWRFDRSDFFLLIHSKSWASLSRLPTSFLDILYFLGNILH